MMKYIFFFPLRIQVSWSFFETCMSFHLLHFLFWEPLHSAHDWHPHQRTCSHSPTCDIRSSFSIWNFLCARIPDSGFQSINYFQLCLKALTIWSGLAETLLGTTSDSRGTFAKFRGSKFDTSTAHDHVKFDVWTKAAFQGEVDFIHVAKRERLAIHSGR